MANKRKLRLLTGDTSTVKLFPVSIILTLFYMITQIWKIQNRPFRQNPDVLFLGTEVEKFYQIFAEVRFGSNASVTNTRRTPPFPVTNSEKIN
tara:strand:- start:7199 stop:7477 length:279 start_codon:yes stop_codon:yes gene_type:complete